jgi:hypothetical protein
VFNIVQRSINFGVYAVQRSHILSYQKRLSFAGHVIGAVAAVALFGTLGATAKPAVGPAMPEGIDYVLLDKPTCRALFQQALSEARSGGVRHWIWADESPAIGTPGHIHIMSRARALQEGLNSSPLWSTEFSSPVGKRPVASAIATDTQGVVPDTACSFARNDVHIRPKA